VSIRRRLALTFLAILLLFAVNLAIYSWSAILRSRTVEAFDRALKRQVALSALNQELDNLHKQITLLSQLQSEEASQTPAAAGGSDPGISEEERVTFANQLAEVRAHIRELQNLTDTSERSGIDEIADTYNQLGEAWLGFYQYMGTEQTVSLAQLIRADPLTRRLLVQLLPELEKSEQQRVHTAELQSTSVARFTERITVVIFAISAFVGLLVALSISRYLNSVLRLLMKGASAFGKGDLRHKIELARDDEMGRLADAFNEMAGNLLNARTEMEKTQLELKIRNQEVETQRQVSESLLLQILPAKVAAELQARGSVQPKYFDDVTIIFTDFKGFTLSTEKLAAEELVYLLHDYFTAFDEITSRYGLEKLKTIGDSYMCAGGLPQRNSSHPIDAVLAAFEFVKVVQDRDRPDGQVHWQVRIGIHSGAVIAGVVGIQKFAFDIWGDTVNFASRMESSGVPNRINLSSATHTRIKDFIQCEYRGKVQTKEKREYDMYLAEGILPNLVNDSSCPPSAFVRRYHTYYEKDPPSFPSFLVDQTARLDTEVSRGPDADVTANTSLTFDRTHE